MVETGAVILAGGKSRRMGRDKTLLAIAGETLLCHALKAISPFEEKLLSADRLGRYEGDVPADVRIVPDAYPGGGAIVGILSALERCSSDRLVAVAADMPFVTGDFLEALVKRMPPEVDVLLPRTRGGQLHPLCAVYHKRIVPLLRERVDRGDRRLMSVIASAPILQLPLAGTPYADELLCNLNTPSDYHRAIQLIEKGMEKSS